MPAPGTATGKRVRKGWENGVGAKENQIDLLYWCEWNDTKHVSRLSSTLIDLLMYFDHDYVFAAARFILISSSDCVCRGGWLKWNNNRNGVKVKWTPSRVHERGWKSINWLVDWISTKVDCWSFEPTSTNFDSLNFLELRPLSGPF